MALAVEGGLNPGDRVWVGQLERRQQAAAATAACATGDRCVSTASKILGVAEAISMVAPIPTFGKFKLAGAALRAAFRGSDAEKAAVSQLAKRRLAKEGVGVPRSATPVAQGGSAKTGRWWEYKDKDGKLKIVVEHPDGTVHAGIPKPQSMHRTGGPPKFYDHANLGHVGQ